jgi:hypothetical protein
MKQILTALLLMLSFYGYSQKQDTIPVILLVCDTSTHGKLLPYEIPNVFWIRGYEVNGTYLDKNKKPTTLVVWDRRKL